MFSVNSMCRPALKGQPVSGGLSAIPQLASGTSVPLSSGPLMGSGDLEDDGAASASGSHARGRGDVGHVPLQAHSIQNGI